MNFEVNKNGKLTKYTGTETNIAIPQEIGGYKLPQSAAGRLFPKGWKALYCLKA